MLPIILIETFQHSPIKRNAPSFLPFVLPPSTTTAHTHTTPRYNFFLPRLVSLPILSAHVSRTSLQLPSSIFQLFHLFHDSSVSIKALTNSFIHFYWIHIWWYNLAKNKGIKISKKKKKRMEWNFLKIFKFKIVSVSISWLWAFLKKGEYNVSFILCIQLI